MDLAQVQELEEISGHGIRGLVDGKEILCGNEKLMTRYGVAVRDAAATGYGTQVLVAEDGVLLGIITVADTIKEDAATAIGRLKGMGLRTVMLTGDEEGAAQAVRVQTGIDEVRSRLLPDEKLDALRSIRGEHGAAMFVGDGINDAPVLSGADVGAAMGGGADAAIEAADVVFMTGAVSAVPEALQIARRTRQIAWQNVVFALAVKALVMVLGLTGHASMWAAVFADSGVAMLCVLNSIRMLYGKK